MKITVQLTPDSLITYMDESELLKSESGFDNAVETTSVVEYRLRSDPDGPAVHRSVNTKLKQWPVAVGGAGGVG